MSKKKRKYISEKKKQALLFKFNEDDILEILTEYLAEKSGFGTFTSKAILLGTPSEDLRLIAVVADLEQNLSEYNLEEIDKSMDFNGDHSGEVYKESCMCLEHLSKINN